MPRGKQNYPVNIPEGITPDEFVAIDNMLHDILEDIRASQVSMRLNESRRNSGEPGDQAPFFPFSFFVGSVQDEQTKQDRENRQILYSGLYRFGDNVPSKEIREAVQKSIVGNQNYLFAVRDWKAQRADSERKKGMGSKGMGRESGITYQEYVGIRVNGLCVGTLGVSFREQPQNIQEVNKKILGWVREPGSPPTLINYLRNTFNVWGPLCP